MVNVSYQMVLSTLQTVALIVGISYYILTLRNQNRARQVQTFLSLYSTISTYEHGQNVNELMDMEWKDYDDFERKYGSEVNPRNRALRYTYWYLFDGIGFILKKRWVDRDVMFALLNTASVQWLWKKHEPLIKEIRKRYNLPNLAVNFEYLIEDNRKMLLERGQSPDPPEEYGKYTPDQ